MRALLHNDARIQTPAFVYDEQTLERLVGWHVSRLGEIGCDVLFALKSFAVFDALVFMGPQLAGFAASSLNEARLAKEALQGSSGAVHFTSPGLRAEDVRDLAECVDFVSFNSLSQLKRLRRTLQGKVSLGLRVNPRVSSVSDTRYDPCRIRSKLGVPLEQLAQHATDLVGVEGLLIHANCEGTDLNTVTRAVEAVEKAMPTGLANLRWLNLGGGYLFEECTGWDRFASTVRRLREQHGLRVLVEPGKSLVAKAGFIVASVVDIFGQDGSKIAVLDTSVSHMPEVFEYQFEPDVEGHKDDGRHPYSLVGATCLAGDVFGQYRFDRPLHIGSRVTFPNAGAYTLVKASFFNGFNLPRIYGRELGGHLSLKKQFTYADFLERCGAETHVGV